MDLMGLLSTKNENRIGFMVANTFDFPKSGGLEANGELLELCCRAGISLKQTKEAVDVAQLGRDSNHFHWKFH